jgi:aryl-alcohol dehydrogenase-like predicted oxidoreductase
VNVRHACLGLNGITASRIGFGCMGLSGTYGPVERAQATAALHAALDAGIDFFDTADVYGGGENERLVGEALRPHRQRVVLATKGGATRDAQGRATNDGSPEYLVRACEASLQRLGVETIDLYYLHRVDPRVPIEDSMGALARLVEQGKVRAIGLSEVGPQTLRKACKVHPVAALQTEYSLACRFVEDEILPACRDLGVSFVAYSPLGRGLLGGGLLDQPTLPAGDLRAAIPRFQPGNVEANLRAARRLRDLAVQLSLTPAQLALGWVLRPRGAPFAIPGSRDGERVRANAAAAEVVLPPSALRELDELLTKAPIVGARHTAAMLARTGL